MSDFISKAALAAALCLTTSACASHYVTHPGALNTADSAAYDTLLVAQAAIDQTRIALNSGQLPSSARAPLNTLIQSYNIAHESWLAYRSALATGLPPDVYLKNLNNSLADLTNAIRAVKETK